MKKLALTISILLVVSGCATAPQSQLRTLSHEEASAFERELLARPAKPVEPLEKLFVQPANKDEPCKLPTSKDQLARQNFKAYWDGQCKDGYAFGLGRDIAISDTHHLEEITIHGGSEDDYAKQPWVMYDFVNSTTAYGIRGEQYPATSGVKQFIKNDSTGFMTIFTLGLTDESGNNIFVLTSPLWPQKIYTNSQGNVSYRLTDFADAPAASNAALKVVEIVDSKTGVAGGVRIVQFRNGAVEHQKLDLSGQVTERAALPQEYANHLLAMVAKTQEAISIANASAQKAQQMEREYLYMACNGKHTIKGLDNAIATKICTWNDQWKEPYAQAQTKYLQQLEQARQQAANAEQQRLIQQQIVAQQQAIAQQQAMLQMQQTRQSIEQTNQRTNQLLQGILNNPPQVQPIAPPGGNQITCINGGVVTNCTY